jgi:ABC-type glycerol-3-phosphate transport system substrate-binding protein
MPTPSPTPEPSPTPAYKDLKNREITLAFSDASPVFLPVDTDAEKSSPIESAKYQHFLKVCENFNVTVKPVFIPDETYLNTVITSVQSGAPVADMVLLDASPTLNFILSGLLIPYEDFLPGDHDLFNAQDYVTRTAEHGGKTWTANGAGLGTAAYGGEFLGVNMDIIRKTGAEDPAELYDRGEWTTEKFLEICRMATLDTDGDGETDQFGIAGRPSDIAKQIIAGAGGKLVNDHFEYGLGEPAALRGMEYVRRIFGIDRVWNYDPATDFFGGAPHDSLFLEGRSAFWHCTLDLLAENDFPSSMSFDHVAVPYPRDPETNPGAVSFSSGFLPGFFIPKGVEKPGDVFAVFFESAKWMGENFALRDMDDMEPFIARSVSEIDAARIAEALGGGRGLDLGCMTGGTGDGPTYTDILNAIALELYNGTASPEQAAEKYRETGQGIINGTLKRD